MNGTEQVHSTYLLKMGVIKSRLDEELPYSERVRSPQAETGAGSWRVAGQDCRPSCIPLGCCLAGGAEVERRV